MNCLTTRAKQGALRRDICFPALALLSMALGVVLLCGCVPKLEVLNAAEEGDLEKVKVLLKEGHSINEQNPRLKFGWTPLMAAIYQNKTNVVHYLITAGADLNLHAGRGQTAIMWAIESGDDNLDVVQDLIAHGADVLAKDTQGATVLSYAESLPPKPKILAAVQSAIAEREKKTKSP